LFFGSNYLSNRFLSTALFFGTNERRAPLACERQSRRLAVLGYPNL
jgi:hypothetical protein